MICVARCKTNLLVQCKFKKCNNSSFCKKHINYNGKTINDSLYNEEEINTFMNQITINNKLINNNKLIKKNILIAKYILQKYNYKFTNNINLKNTILYFNEFIQYYKNLKSIIKIQSIARKNYIYLINKLKGEGLYNKCINETDFYTFEKKNKVSYNYFFSYNDNSNIYFFDIRSFKLLIDNNPNKIVNPYNRKIIPQEIINNYNQLIKYLIKININIIFEEDILSEEQLFNQKIINIFQKIDSFGYNTSIEWFTQLSHYLLKKFWANLEDIWNYRSNLSVLDKNNIIQKIKPQPFSKFKYINKNIEKKLLQEYILDDINIFLISGKNSSFSNIGCLYVLTALSSVSKPCIETMPWLEQI